MSLSHPLTEDAPPTLVVMHVVDRHWQSTISLHPSREAALAALRDAYEDGAPRDDVDNDETFLDYLRDKEYSIDLEEFTAADCPWLFLPAPDGTR